MYYSAQTPPRHGAGMGGSLGPFMSPGPIQGSSSQIDIATLRKSWLSSFDKYGLEKWPTEKYSAEDWVASLKYFAEQYITDPADRFEAFSLGFSTTSATARTWLALIIPAGIRPTFEDCATAFLDRYGDRNRVQQLEREFFALLAPSDGREADTHIFLDKFANLVDQLGYAEKPLNFLVTFLFRRLAPAVKERILLTRHTRATGDKVPSHGYEELTPIYSAISAAAGAVAASSSVGRPHPRERKPVPGSHSSSSSSSSAFVPCHAHPHGSHEWKDCSTNPAVKKNPKKPQTLKRKFNPSARVAAAPVPPRTITCYSCGQVGHLSLACPSRPAAPKK
jgi:hypothetical protein